MRILLFYGAIKSHFKMEFGAFLLPLRNEFPFSSTLNLVMFESEHWQKMRYWCDLFLSSHSHKTYFRALLSECHLSLKRKWNCAKWTCEIFNMLSYSSLAQTLPRHRRLWGISKWEVSLHETSRPELISLIKIFGTKKVQFLSRWLVQTNGLD